MYERKDGGRNTVGNKIKLFYMNIKLLKLGSPIPKFQQAGTKLKEESIDIICCSKTDQHWNKFLENRVKFDL